jgi:hypothetical protein
MSEKVDLHRAAYQKFFDAVNEGDWGKIDVTVKEGFIQGCIIHTVGKPEQDVTIEEYMKNYKRDSEKLANQSIAFENCFSVGNLMASHVIYETIDKETNERRRHELFFVDRFEGDRVAEEWSW